ncbi:hypothetical protein BM1_07363 [Bipolaris maydis]|nr:hypothetical protein BM1_07363 [Bipolaris maydis]
MEALLAVLAIIVALVTARFSFNLSIHGESSGDECWTAWNVWDDHVPLNRGFGPYECRKNRDILNNAPILDSSTYNTP